MSLTKSDIAKNITFKAHISLNQSSLFLNSFINHIKKNSLEKTIKISGFGSFFRRNTPKRIGRNPKTMDTFLIPNRSKLFFKVSNSIKKILN
jgi:integration host factor subunit alpha